METETLQPSAKEKWVCKNTLRNARCLILASYIFLCYNQLFGLRIGSLKVEILSNIPVLYSTYGILPVLDYISFFIPSLLLLTAGIQFLKSTDSQLSRIGKELICASVINLLYFLFIMKAVSLLGSNSTSIFIYILFSLCFNFLLLSVYDKIKSKKEMIKGINVKSYLYSGTFIIAFMDFISFLDDSRPLGSGIISSTSYLYILPIIASFFICLFWNKMLNKEFFELEKPTKVSFINMRITRTMISFAIAYLIFVFIILIY